MNKQYLLTSAVGCVLMLAAGCASLQTEIIQDPGKIDSITVGRFITANPVDDELIGSYLRKELAKRGFRVVDDSPYTLSGTIDVHSYYSRVVEARFILKKDYSDQIVWSFQSGIELYKSRKNFARYMAERIAKKLR